MGINDLLIWLGESDFSQYGECHGRLLDALVEQGLAQIHEGRDHQSSFIAQGDGPMYRAVSLTEAGIAALESVRKKQPTQENLTAAKTDR